MDSQLKRGVLDSLVLSTLLNSKSYGYKIIKEVSCCMEISESTLYPILRRLEQENSVSVESVEHNGRLRKYYSITNKGIQKIDDFLIEFKTITGIYDFILGERKKRINKNL